MTPTRALASFLLLGCGSKTTDKPPQKPSGGPSEATAPEGLPPLFAPLFKSDARSGYLWSFSVDTHDEEGSQATLDVDVDCVIKDVRQVASARVSEMICEARELPEAEVAALALSAVWVATKQGLWRKDALPQSPKEIEALLQGDPWLPYPPAPAERDWSTEEDGMVAEHTMSISSPDDGVTWCREEKSKGGSHPPGRGCAPECIVI